MEIIKKGEGKEKSLVAFCSAMANDLCIVNLPFISIGEMDEAEVRYLLEENQRLGVIHGENPTVGYRNLFINTLYEVTSFKIKIFNSGDRLKMRIEGDQLKAIN